MLWAKWILLILWIMGFTITIMDYGKEKTERTGWSSLVASIITFVVIYFAGAFPF